MRCCRCLILLFVALWQTNNILRGGRLLTDGGLFYIVPDDLLPSQTDKTSLLEEKEVVDAKRDSLREEEEYARSFLRSYPNPTHGMTGQGLVDLMNTMSYVRNANLTGKHNEAQAFEADLRELVRRHHQTQPQGCADQQKMTHAPADGQPGGAFSMPWICNAAFLRPVPVK